MRELLPDDVGVSVSYPLPGTRFFDMVQAELGEQTHWRDSNDLAMMFQGTYQTPFYRRLRQLVHRDLEMRRGKVPAEELERLEADWRILEGGRPSSRSALPTMVHKGRTPSPRPISRGPGTDGRPAAHPRLFPSPRTRRSWRS